MQRMLHVARDKGQLNSAIQVITLCQTVVFGDSWGATAIEPWLCRGSPVFLYGEMLIAEISSHSSSLLRSSSCDNM